MTAKKSVHAFCNDALGDSDAVELAARIRNGNVSAGEVAEAAIARAEAVEPLISAIELACKDRGRAAAA